MSEPRERVPHQGIEDLGYDRGEVRTSSIVIVTALSIAFLIFVFVALDFYYNRFRDSYIERLQLEPVSQDYLNLQQREARHLSSYGVWDKQVGSYRIPVDKAMDLIVTESAPGGAWKFNTKTYAVKKPEDLAAEAAGQPGAQPAQPGGQMAQPGAPPAQPGAQPPPQPEQKK